MVKLQMVYVCEVCKRHHLDDKSAETCEEGHKKIATVGEVDTAKNMTAMDVKEITKRIINEEINELLARYNKRIGDYWVAKGLPYVKEEVNKKKQYTITSDMTIVGNVPAIKTLNIDLKRIH